jgi:hypothetical protein
VNKTIIIITVCLLFSLIGCEKKENELQKIKEFDFEKNRRSLAFLIYTIPSNGILYEAIFPTADVIKERYTYKVEVRGIELHHSYNENVFKELNQVDYSPIDKPSDIGYGIYCEIFQMDREIKKGRAFLRYRFIMSFGISGHEVIMINDKYPIKYQPVFRKLIDPFIP